MSFVPDEIELDRAWLKIEVSAEHGEDTKIDILPSPYAMVGTAIEPQHVVIQVCVGAEHGVMRTDAGIAFTWGDNRYGQLGRAPVQKEEGGSPYPIVDLLDEEIVMVAAGKNHCLALTSDGLVKAWGRNKQGQLGIGSFRDRTEPKWVRLMPKNDTDDADSGPKLGEVAGDKFTGQNPKCVSTSKIVTISAGANSSIAAGFNADVWQWGELNTDYKEELQGTEKRHHNPKDKEALGPARKDRPKLIASWGRQSFRTQMRKERDMVSISDTDFMVLGKTGNVMEDVRRKDEIATMVEESRRWTLEIGKERDSKRKLDEKKASGNQNKGDADEGDGGGVGDLQDTIAFLEKDIDNVNRDIDWISKNIQSCEQQQKHNRRQIEMLTHQATTLTNSQGKFSQEMLENKKTGPQKKLLETQLMEIKDFIEANQNTRATLLDQRAETDKEKQRLNAEHVYKVSLKDGLEQRRKMVTFLGQNAKSSSGASDKFVGRLGKLKDNLIAHFEGKLQGQADILEAKKRMEKDESFLRNSEQSMQEYVKIHSEHGGMGFRPEVCKSLLDDLVALRRRLTDMTNDKYLKEDLSFESFFQGAAMPEEG